MSTFVFQKADTIEQTVDELIKRISWLTSRLDSRNISWLETAVTDLLNAYGQSIVDENGNIIADLIVGNIIIAQALYAEKGYISQLVVDELLTEDKVSKYLSSNTAAINYIHIYNQYTDYRTATYTSVAETGTTTTSIVITNHGLSTGDTIYNSTRGVSRTITVVDDDTFTVASITSQTVGDLILQHAENNENKLLYWTDDTYLQSTIEVTDYPVYVYIYNDLVKLQIGFNNVDGTQTPMIVYGAGAGVSGHPDYGKGYSYKDTTGLIHKYIQNDGTEIYFKLGEDGITSDPVISGGSGTTFEYLAAIPTDLSSYEEGAGIAIPAS